MEWLKKLYVQVLIGLVLGVLLGYFYPDFSVQLKPLSDIFIRLIKMLIAPIIFLTIVSGVSMMSDVRQVGKLGGAALAFFLLTTTIALIFGLFAADYFKPGEGLNIDASSLNLDDAKTYTGEIHKPASITELLLNIIPRTFFSAFVDGEILQVLFIAVLFALGVSRLGEVGRPLLDSLKTISRIFFQIIHGVMYLAPMATCAAMAFSIGKYGIAPLYHLIGLVLCYYLTCLFFILAVLGTCLHLFCRISLLDLLRYFKPELLIVWGTASSETVLPSLMEKLELLGVKKSIVGLVLPLGYSFNLAGTAIYLTMAAMFIAQATNTELTFPQELALLSIMVISSKGAAGVSGSGFIVLASSLAALGTIPVAGVVLVLGIDKFMNEGRAIINMISNAIATLLIAQWQNEFDYDAARTILDFPAIKKLKEELQV